MEYKLTFEDGSSAYLNHFGVKGMHWGVWNEETRKRRTGGGKNISPARKRQLSFAKYVIGVNALYLGATAIEKVSDHYIKQGKHQVVKALVRLG